MVDEGECKYYLGMHVEQGTDGITIHQEQYVEQLLEKYDMQDAMPVSTPLDKRAKLKKQKDSIADPAFKKLYQSKVGSLNYLVDYTRPDIAFAVGYTARYASNPDQSHMDAVDQILAYVSGTRQLGLCFTNQGETRLIGFVDSDFANCEDSRKSTTGYVFLFAGAPISWSSKRQSTIAQSTMDAEYIAASEAARDAVWIRNFLNDLRIRDIAVKTVPLGIDNNCALKLTRNPEFHARAKHIEVK